METSKTDEIEFVETAVMPARFARCYNFNRVIFRFFFPRGYYLAGII